MLLYCNRAYNNEFESSFCNRAMIALLQASLIKWRHCLLSTHISTHQQSCQLTASEADWSKRIREMQYADYEDHTVSPWWALVICAIYLFRLFSELVSTKFRTVCLHEYLKVPVNASKIHAISMANSNQCVGWSHCTGGTSRMPSVLLAIICRRDTALCPLSLG